MIVTEGRNGLETKDPKSRARIGVFILPLILALAAERKKLNFVPTLTSKPEEGDVTAKRIGISPHLPGAFYINRISSLTCNTKEI